MTAPALDLDAIAARAQRVANYADSHDETQLATRDVPALIEEMRRLRERTNGDRREGICGHWMQGAICELSYGHLSAWHEASNGPGHAPMRWRPESDADDIERRVHLKAASVIAERDALLPVVEAARAWRADYKSPYGAPYELDTDLVVAVDALDAKGAA